MRILRLALLLLLLGLLGVGLAIWFAEPTVSTIEVDTDEVGTRFTLRFPGCALAGRAGEAADAVALLSTPALRRGALRRARRRVLPLLRRMPHNRYKTCWGLHPVSAQRPI